MKNFRSLATISSCVILLGACSTNWFEDEFEEVAFVDHIAAGMIEQDVFVEKVPGSGSVFRVDEAEAARWCKDNMKKPVVGFIAGVTAPAGKRMGHAGALISGGEDTADAKLAIMEECGFTVTRNPSEMAKLLKAKL